MPKSVLAGHKKFVRGLSFSHDGGLPASDGADDNTCRMWDAATGRASVIDAGDKVSAVAFVPDSKSLAVACFDRTIKLYDVGDGGPKPRSSAAVGRSAWSVAYSPDGRHLLGYVKDESAGDRVVVWDAASEKEREWAFRQGVHAAGYAPDGRHAVVVTENSATVLRLPASAD